MITGNVVVGPAQTAGTIVIFDGPVTIRGHVTGDVIAFHGPVRVLGGRVNGDVTSATDPITVGPRGFVGGDLQYGDEKPIIAPGARVGGDVKEFTVTDTNPFSGFAFTLLWWLAVTVSTLVLGLVMIALWPRAADAAAAAWARSPGPVIGWGVLFFFGFPVVAVIALVTLVGIPLGIGLFLALAPLYFVGYVTAAFLLGRLLIKAPSSRIVAFLVGLLILQVISLVPFLGPLMWVVATVIGLGALVVAAWRANRPQQAAPVVPA